MRHQTIAVIGGSACRARQERADCHAPPRERCAPDAAARGCDRSQRLRSRPARRFRFPSRRRDQSGRYPSRQARCSLRSAIRQGSRRVAEQDRGRVSGEGRAAPDPHERDRRGFERTEHVSALERRRRKGRTRIEFGDHDFSSVRGVRSRRQLPEPVCVPRTDLPGDPAGVFAGEVPAAKAFATVLDLDAASGRVYELDGPTVYTLEELVRFSGAAIGKHARIIRLSDSLGRLQAMSLELAPGEPMMSRDNLDSMKTPAVASGPMAPELGIEPASIEAIAPMYLTGSSTRSRFNTFRGSAGR